jgi:hypothetical protein
MVEGLFEMIRSGEEGKVQELLAMIHANAPIGSIAAIIEASMKSPEGSQKRKRGVSSSASSKEGIGPADRSKSDDDTERSDARPQDGLIEHETTESRSVSRPASHQATSSDGSIGVTGLALGSDDQSHPILDLAQVRASVSSLACPSLFLYSYH